MTPTTDLAAVVKAELDALEPPVSEVSDTTAVRKPDWPQAADDPRLAAALRAEMALLAEAVE